MSGLFHCQSHKHNQGKIKPSSVPDLFIHSRNTVKQFRYQTNSLTANFKYPLRIPTLFKYLQSIIVADIHDIDDNMALQMAGGLVPKLLVFGAFPPMTELAPPITDSHTMSKYKYNVEGNGGQHRRSVSTENRA
jgi:hypothetical protein